MKQINVKKLLLPNLPYVFIALFATKLGQAARLAPGAKKIYMPGEMEYDRSVKAENEITLMKEIMDDLMALPE